MLQAWMKNLISCQYKKDEKNYVKCKKYKKKISRKR